MLYSDLPLLTMLIFLPMVGAFFVALSRSEKTYEKNVCNITLITSGATFLYAIILFLKADFSSEKFQFMEQATWLPSLGIQYAIGIDGVSILFILLTSLLIFLALCISIKKITFKLKEYCIAFLVLETFILGAFCAMDLFLFYIFFEGVLLPMFFIIGIWGGKHRVHATWKFFLYTLLGSLLMLIGIVCLYLEFNTSSIYALYGQNIELKMQYWIWLAFFASFAVKLPMFPFHTWLPDAHVEAPMAGSIILAGILLKMGGYGFFRLSLPILPEASQYFSTFIFTLSCIAVVYTSMIAFVQKDIKKLIAYSSVAHMGFVTVGLFTFTIYGMQGAIFQMLSHGLISAALFMCVGILYERTNSRELEFYGGVATILPVFAVLMMIFTLGSIGFPGTSGFVGELLVIIGAYQVSGWTALGLGVSVILSALYGLLLYKKVLFGSIKDTCKFLKHLTYGEQTILAALAVLIVIFGLFPQCILDLIEPAVKVILEKTEISTFSTMLNSKVK